jgi:hypothetical protein
VAKVSLTKAECEAVLSAIVDRELRNADNLHDWDDNLKRWDDDPGYVEDVAATMDDIRTVEAESDALASAARKIRIARLRPNRSTR